MKIKYICRECGKKFLDIEDIELEVGKHINKHLDKRYLTPHKAQKLLERYGHNLANIMTINH